MDSLRNIYAAITPISCWASPLSSDMELDLNPLVNDQRKFHVCGQERVPISVVSKFKYIWPGATFNSGLVGFPPLGKFFIRTSIVFPIGFSKSAAFGANLQSSGLLLIRSSSESLYGYVRWKAHCQPSMAFYPLDYVVVHGGHTYLENTL